MGEFYGNRISQQDIEKFDTESEIIYGFMVRISRTKFNSSGVGCDDPIPLAWSRGLSGMFLKLWLGALKRRAMSTRLSQKILVSRFVV